MTIPENKPPSDPSRNSPLNIIQSKFNQRCMLAAKVCLVISAALFALTIVILAISQSGTVNPLIGLGAFSSSLFFAVTGLVVASFMSKAKQST